MEAVFKTTIHNVAHPDWSRRVCRDDLEKWWNAAQQNMCAVVSLLEVLTGIQSGLEERQSLFCQLFVLAAFNQMEEYLKYCTVYLFARHFEQELPKRPEWMSSKPEYFVSGVLGRRMRTVLRPGKPTFKSAVFAYSILQLKRGCAPVNDEFIVKALREFRSRVGKRKVMPDGGIKDVLMYRAINKIIGEVFPKGYVAVPKMNVPSGSAHYESGRKKGGAFGFLKREPNLAFDQMWCMFDTNKPRKVFQVGFPDVCSASHGLYDYEVRVPYFEDRLLDIFEQCRSRSREGRRLPCRAQALCEPFKVRTITAGPAEEYYLCKTWQKVIHREMRKHPLFRLIGEPMDDGHIYSLALRYDDANLDTLNWWVSADYKAATDNLDPEWSDYVMCRIAERVGAWKDMDVLRRALVCHDIEVKYKDLVSETVSQEWGQLMGSPISFPILCILNAAACHVALELRNWELINNNEPYTNLTEDSFVPRLPLNLVLVNGDDALLKTDKRGYEIWKDCTSNVGLEMSMGKNYISQDMIMLNSQCYLVQSRPDSTGEYHMDLVRVPYCNLGLLSGQKRVVQKDVDTFNSVNPNSDLVTLCDLQTELLRFHHSNKRIMEELTTRFVICNRSKLQEDKDWFISEDLGGYGLVSTRSAQPVRGRHVRRAYGYFTTQGGGRVTRTMLPEYALMARKGLPGKIRKLGAYKGKSQGDLSLAFLSSGNEEISRTREQRVAPDVEVPPWFRAKVRYPWGFYTSRLEAYIPSVAMRIPIL